MPERLRLLVIGAHPDDAEYKAGGLAAHYRRAGHDVRFVSVTDGRSGHHETWGEPLARRRMAEASEAAARLGLSYEVWDEPDGGLEPSLACRERVIRLVRTFRPDLVLTHRPNDYHPDHRAVSLVVQDAAYLLTVPAVCPDVPHLKRDPVIAYLSDDFTKPCPFEPSVVVDADPVWDEKVALLDAHRSQFYEWLPYNLGVAEQVPPTDDARRDWLSDWITRMDSRVADRFRDRLVAGLGPERGAVVRRAEAFEWCEYGGRFDARLFEGLPAFVATPHTGR